MFLRCERSGYGSEREFLMNSDRITTVELSGEDDGCCNVFFEPSKLERNMYGTAPAIFRSDNLEYIAALLNGYSKR